MSVTIRRTWKVGGVLTDVTTAVLRDPTGAYGIKRDDTGAAVVAAGVAMTHESTGTYSYTLTGMEDGVAYTAWVEFVHGGQTYHFEHDIDATTTSALGVALSHNYASLKTAIADFLGWGRSGDGWNEEEIDRLDAIIKSAVTQVYYPVAVAQEGTVHQWSWMRPTSVLSTSAPYDTGTVTVVDGVVTLDSGTFPDWAAQGEFTVDGEVYQVASRDSDTQITLTDTTVAVAAGAKYNLARYLYDLPADFNGFEGSMHYRREQASLWPSVELTSDTAIRSRRQHWAGVDRPRYVAYRPKSFVAAVGQRWQAAFHPTPNGAYDLLYRYKVQPTTLSDSHPFPLGGPEVGEVILESCLAVAEQRYRDEQGIHTEAFLAKLRAAIVNDAMSHSPDTLGYNADRSEQGPDRFGGEALHSYEGVYYYDRNP